QVRRVTRVADGWRRLFMEAVVADEPPARAVKGERHVAVRTLPDFPAVAALHEVRVAPPVQEQDRLLVVAQAPLYRRDERLRQGRPLAPPGRATLRPQVDDVDRRERVSGRALRQRDECVLPVRRVVKALE